MQHDDSHEEVARREVARRLTRRAALQLGAGVGAAVVAAPYVVHLGGARAVDVGEARVIFARVPDWPVPPIVTRAQWGANEALRRAGQIYDVSVTKIVVHHTGTPNDVTDYAGLCRGILANETSGEYIDIAYNWLIDPNGRIYEGRWAQNYAANAAHTGELNGTNVRGAHAIYHNANTIGVALMGTYDTINPPPAMLEALVTLLAWKCARWGIDPLARGAFRAGNGVLENLFNICGHRDTSATDCPGQRVEPMLPSIRAKVAARISGTSYWIATNLGQVLAFGGAPVVNAASFHVTSPIVGIAGHPSATGYWLFAGDGSVYAFGNAGFYGGMHGRALAAPVVGMTATPSGRGYWLVAGDGGIFSFGDAAFHGSTGNIRLNQPVVSMAARPQGDGYWMIARDGGLFAFGRAPFAGSAARSPSSSPYVAMLPSTTGKGYAMLRADGHLAPFGDAPDLGDGYGRVLGQAVGVAGRLEPL